MRITASLLAVNLCSIALAPMVAAPATPHRVTYEARALSFSRALAMFERLTHVNFVLDPKLSDTRVTVSIRDLPVEEAVRAFGEAARRDIPDLLLEEKDGIYRFSLKTGGKVPPRRFPRPEPGSARKLNVAFGNVLFREAVELIYRQPATPAGKSPVSIEAEVPDTPINLVYSDDAEPWVLRSVVRQAMPVTPNLRLEEKDGQLTLGIRPNAQREPPPRIRPNAPPLGVADRRIVLAFRGAPLRFVLRAVLDSTLPTFGPTPEYDISDQVPDAPISFTLVTLNPEQALATTLAELKKQVRGLTIQPGEGKLHFTGPVP